ncbi:MAG: DUF4388 domain-containing protein [Actinomycetota bacterium]
MDILQGDLGAFAVADVLRLLAAGGKTGVLRIETSVFTGRIYFIEGHVTYATTRDADGTVAALADLQEPSARDRRGRNPGGKWPRPARPLVLQQISEVLIRLTNDGPGRFWFVDDVRTRAYGDAEAESLDVEEVMRAAGERRSEWERIVRVLPDLSARYAMRPRLAGGRRSVEVDADSWAVLAAIGAGATTGELAERLSMFELSAAGLLADLYERGLVSLEHATDPPVVVSVDVNAAS